MSHIIAIYGRSCVGKSVVAEELSKALQLRIRHCGEAIKDRAKELGVDAADLPVDEHKVIDEQTRLLAKVCTDGMVIEGGFLDAVLKNIPNILLIHLTCEDGTRERRFIGRPNGQASAHDLHLRDASDIALRELLYKTSGSGNTLLTIDTTNLEVDEVVQVIISWIHTSRDQPEKK
jgi:cytidylate kinase